MTIHKDSTQVPFVLQIGVKNEKMAIKRNYYRISFTKQQNEITKENIYLLQLLDCMRFFKQISDTTSDETSRRLLLLLNKLDKKLNPQTFYKLGISDAILFNQKNGIFDEFT